MVEPIHSILYSVAQTFKMVSKSYCYIIQGWEGEKSRSDRGGA